MKGKLTKITNIYTLLDKNDRMIASDDLDMQKDYQIGKLSKENCDEIFGVYSPSELSKVLTEGERGAFEFGYCLAREHNKDKVFTLEDVESAMRCMISQEIFYGETHEETQQMRQTYIKSYIDFLAKEPTEIEVEIEMEKYGYCEGCRKAGMWHCAHADTCGYAETRERQNLDSEGCLILKKI